MMKKVVVIIALAIALLSISVVSAYAAVKDATQKKIYVERVMYIGNERYSFKGWVTVDEDGHYSTPMYDDEGNFQFYADENGGILFITPLHSNPMYLDAVSGSCVSAASGVTGIGCLATVFIKRRKGVW
jgi:hypothetical protein